MDYCVTLVEGGGWERGAGVLCNVLHPVCIPGVEFPGLYQRLFQSNWVFVRVLTSTDLAESLTKQPTLPENTRIACSHERGKNNAHHAGIK